MRGPDDSKLTKQTDPAIRTPRCTLTEAEFRQLRARYDEIFQETEDDFAQQDANEAISGPGRSHFHPADRPTHPHPIVKSHSSGEIRSVYAPPEAETIMSACRTAIEIHQTMYRIDPLQIRISTIMYFDLSEAMRTMYGIAFTGKLSFIGISNTICYVDVRVYSDTSTNIVICVH